MRSKKLNRHKWTKISRKRFKPASMVITCPRCFTGYVEEGSTDHLKRQYYHKVEQILISYYTCPSCGYDKWKAIECTGDRATQIMSKPTDE